MNDASVELIRTLCRIDTRSRSNPSGSVEAGEILSSELEPLGFRCETVAPEEPDVRDARHLIAVRNPEAKRKIVLLGHIDTVLSPEELPFRIDEPAGRIYGSGVADMKGGLVVLLEALKIALRDPSFASDVGVTVVINASEEIALPSFTPLARSICAGAAIVLNFEPSYPGKSGEHGIVKGRKGIRTYRIISRGHAVHAGSSHASGANAIREIARKIEKIEQLNDPCRGISANVGWIRGGNASNQVPDFAEIRFEIRGLDTPSLDETEQSVEKILADGRVESLDRLHSCSSVIEKFSDLLPYPENERNRALVQRYAEIARTHGITIVSAVRGGISDSNCVADLAPVIDGLGILGEGFHGLGEWADLRSLDTRIRIAAEFMRTCRHLP